MRIVKSSGKASNAAMNEYAVNVSKNAAPFKGGSEHSGRGKVRARAGGGIKKSK